MGRRGEDEQDHGEEGVDDEEEVVHGEGEEGEVGKVKRIFRMMLVVRSQEESASLNPMMEGWRMVKLEERENNGRTSSKSRSPLVVPL